MSRAEDVTPPERTQSQESVESFAWQWTEQTVVDSTRTFYRRLYADMGLWSDHHDGKTIAYVCSGNGRHVWALRQLSKAAKIISVELSEVSAEHQRRFFRDEPTIEVIQGDAAQVAFKADVIYLVGAIQHTAEPLRTLQRVVDNLSEGGELIVSFYLVTPATMVLEPLRAMTRRLPRSTLWHLTVLLAPIFMLRKAGRETGFRNARHTAHDWFGGHAYQHYFSEGQIAGMFRAVGIHPDNVLRLRKGLYKVRAGRGPVLDDTIHSFGAG